MPVQQEPVNLGDLLKYEASHYYSRDTAIVAAGQQLSLGTLVGQENSSGKLFALDPSKTDGTQNTVGILAADVDATLADAEALLVARHAIVSPEALIWPVGINANKKNKAIEQLKELGVLIRVAA